MPIASRRKPHARAAYEPVCRDYFLWIALAALAMVFLVHAPALGYGYVYDDHAQVYEAGVDSQATLSNYFSKGWGPFGAAPVFYRPLFLIWMRLNYMIFEGSSAGWHAGSLLLDLLCGVLLFLVARRLLNNRWAALLVALLFCLHPAHAESAVCISSSSDSLMGLPFLAALYCLLRAGVVLNPARPRHGKNLETESHGWGWLTLAAVFCFLAVLAKETAVVLPVIALLFLFSEPGADAMRRTGRAALRSLPLFAATAAYFLMRRAALGCWMAPAQQHLPASSVILTAPLAAWFYVKAIFWPVTLRAYGDPVVSSSFSVPGVLLPALGALAVLVALAAATWWALRGGKVRETDGSRAAWLGWLLLVLPLLPAFNLNGLYYGDFLHGRYTYLSVAGVLLLLGAFFLTLREYGRIVLGASLAVALLFAACTLLQQSAWADDDSFFNAAYRAAPRDQRMATMYALQLDAAGRCDEALPILRTVLRDTRNDSIPWAALGDCLRQKYDLGGAEYALGQAARISHDPRIEQEMQAIHQMRLNGAQRR
ncbi:MAG: phospholipid carrier-dependent glycosyltransferase [Acidobacteriota bacterium]|nr:phospholipid carrier-dependent glycosyltransferase [Acidobacteriota bacterium]